LRGGYQQSVTIDQPDAADMAVLRNDHVEAHDALDAGLPVKRRIDSINYWAGFSKNSA